MRLDSLRALSPTRHAHGQRFPVTLVTSIAGMFALALGVFLLPEASRTLRLGLVLGGLVVLLFALDRGLTRLFKAPVEKVLLFAVAWLALVGFLAIFADLLPLSESLNPGNTLHEPTLAPPNLLSDHPLGTDRQGLDLLGGLAYGARISLTVGLGATMLGGLVGVVIGLSAGFLRGRVDRLIGYLTDSMLAFPPLILLLAVVAVVKPSTLVMTCALGVLTIPSYTRLARANTLALAHREFVLTSQAMGATRRRIVFRELFPNVFWPLVSYSIVVVAAMITAEASLSYLGLSIQRPFPTWGNMIAAGQDSFDIYPHLVLIPGAAMFFTVLALNAVGERLQASYSMTNRNR